jgi:hypothetical protein
VPQVGDSYRESGTEAADGVIALVTIRKQAGEPNGVGQLRLC